MAKAEFGLLMKDFSFYVESEINSTREVLWLHVTQMKNVNDELFPFVYMTYPKNLGNIVFLTVPSRQVVFRSILLFLGFIPIDIHYLRLDEVKQDWSFHENSYSLQHHYWRHIRIISERNGKVFIKDELHFSPRISFLGNFLLSVYKVIFQHRHKRLCNVFKQN